MTIAVADSWEGRSTTSTLNVAVTGIAIGDIISVVTFCAGSGSGDGLTTDDAGNVYTTQVETPAGGAYTYTVAVADAIVEVVPTQVSVANSAGGANDVAAVVMRISHDGTGWLDKGSPITETSGLDDPTSGASGVSDSSTQAFAGPGSALFIAALTHDGTTTTFAPQSGWTEVEEEEDAAGGIPYSVVSRVYIDQPGTITHQWTTGAARDYAMAILGYTENIADLEVTEVDVAPSPAITGLTMDPTSPGNFPDPDIYTYHVLVGPPDAVPDTFNSELVRVVGLTAGTWDIERAQGGTRAHAIEVGWIIWRDHIYYNNPQGLVVEAASNRLKTALATIPWP